MMKICSKINLKISTQATSQRHCFRKVSLRSDLPRCASITLLEMICSSPPSDMICALGETTGPVALRYMRHKMMNDPVGRQILEEEPLITTETISLPYLESLPDNTFGKAYWRFLDKNGFSPDARRPVNFVDDPELMYVMLRYRQLHDLMHTMLDMPTNMLGEVVVKWFEAIQTGLPMCTMGALVGPVRLGPKHRQKYLSVYLPWVLRNAYNARFFMSVYFEQHWEQDMDEFRKELNLEPSPAPLVKTGVGTLAP